MTPYVVASSFWNTFVASSSLITASELGDKTFFITSIMSVQKSRSTVFLASLSAMTVMNVLSIGIGILSKHIPQWFIHYISIGLFLLFGFKMMIEGIKMTEEEGQQEYMEAQKCIKEKNKKYKTIETRPNVLFKLFGQEVLVFMQVFSIIFLAEWGDKSQISTVLLAAKDCIWAVGAGAFVGYFICSTIAVLCARVIAKIISVRKVTIIGGVVFIVCAVFKLN